MPAKPRRPRPWGRGGRSPSPARVSSKPVESDLLPVRLFGAGHVGQAIAARAAGLPLAIAWYDSRPEMAETPGVVLADEDGLDNVRFRALVRVGDRLVPIAKGIRLHRRQTIFHVQGFVGPVMVFHADVMGIPMARKDEA